MNLTAGAICNRRALELAREIFNSDDDECLIRILWDMTRYPFETNELALEDDLRAWKNEIEKGKANE